MIRRSFFGKLAHTPRSASDDAASPGVSDPDAPETVHHMLELEKRQNVGMSASDHLADSISAFAGSMHYVWLHFVWFGAWIAINTPWLGWNFDPFPFGLLTMIVSLEAIFLSTFVLISQNRQALLSDKRAKLDLQVNLIAEQEVTKVLALLAEIHSHLGISDEHDEEVRSMQEPTELLKLADAMEGAETPGDSS